jgi:DNA-binding response OmpR family regulator
MAKILLVEDDEALRSMLADWLSMQLHVVEQVGDGIAAMEFLRSYKYDVIILDWQLPGLSGIDVCKQFRSMSGLTPVIMFTSQSDVSDKEEGLDAGADDYCTKPIDFVELAARMRALLRRTAIGPLQQVVGAGLILEPAMGRVVVGTQSVSLPPMEMELLELLVKNRGAYLTTDAIVARLWGDSGSRASLANCLKRLRQKLAVAGQSNLIETSSGLGYRIRAGGDTNEWMSGVN